MREETPRPIMLYVKSGMFIGKEIVFCKDCKYWTEDLPHNAYCECMKLHGFESDDFCSRGERRWVSIDHQ